VAKPLVTRHWYRVALWTPSGPRVVASSGEHMGRAIVDAVDAIDCHGTRAFAVDLPVGEDIPLGESVGKRQIVALSDAPPSGSDFQWPVGVLPSFAGAEKLAAARRGWVTRPRQDLLVIEAQTDADHIIDLFLGLIERLPSADNLEVRLLDHFEDAASTDVWLTSRVDAKKILRFLDDYDEELIGNGHLELSVYVRKHKATLRLTEHKTVLWLAEDRALADEVGRWLRELEIPHAHELVTVRDAPHFHYRPAKSRDRKKLGEELYRQRLRRVDSLKRETAG
jgi:hypothetical protein